MRLAICAPLVLAAACGPAQYTFVAPELPIANPSGGTALGSGQAVAVDGLTKHKWETFTPTEACFDSRLEDLTADSVVPRRPFLLMGFSDESQPLASVPTIASSRVTVKTSGQEDVATEERRMALPHVDVEVCFRDPGRVVKPATRYVVLRVPYSVQSEAIGSAGSRDGVWRLTR
jgi:hypothetical protein